MIQSFSDLWDIVFRVSGIFLILFFFYRKHIVHLFDPLLFYVVAQSFTITLAFMVIDKTSYLINFLGCEACFLTAFLLAAGKPLTTSDFQNATLFKRVNFFQISVLKWYIIFAFIALIIANLISFKISGIPVLSEDPSAAKVENFRGGLGFVKRMNSGMLYFVGWALMALYLSKNKYKYLVLFLIILLVPAASGSKGALLYFVLVISFFNCFRDIRESSAYKKIKIFNFLLFISAIFLASIIVSGGAGDSDSLNDKIFKLATRFLYFGDSIIYYYNESSIQYFSHNNFISFIKDELGDTLALFRIIPYSLQLGFQLSNYYFNVYSETWGPNIPYYIKGNIYFGYYGAFIYSFIIGTIVGFVRRLFYTLVRNGSSSIWYVLLVIDLNMTNTTIAQDSQLYLSQLFDTILFSMPFIIAAMSLHFKKNTGLAFS
jgi:oligosaccharide repeat unit polymerase